MTDFGDFQENRMIVSGAPEGFDALLIARHIAKTQQPVLHIARDDRRLAEMKSALAFFAPETAVFVFPAWDCLPYDRISPNANISANRMATLAALAEQKLSKFVVLTSLAAVTQRIPSRKTVSASSFSAKVGGRIDEGALRRYFSEMGFVQTPTVMEPGDFAIRGGLIDVYPPSKRGPIRMDLFGDVLDMARRFDPETQRSLAKLKKVDLAPVSEVILNEKSIERFRKTYRLEFGAAGTDDLLYESVSAGRKYQGVEHWLPFFHDDLETLFDYIPKGDVFIDDQCAQAHNLRWESIEDQYDVRKTALTQKGRMDAVYKPCPPDGLYLSPQVLSEILATRPHRQFAVLPQATGPNVIDAGGRIGRSFAPERQQENINLFASLADHIKSVSQQGKVIIASYTEGARERLSGLLEDQDILNKTLAASWEETKSADISLVVWPLEQGFSAKDITVISEQDVLGDRLVRSSRKRRRAENFLSEAASLSPGDLVVHLDHGIGRYRGLETVTAAGAPHDCILLEYANQDRLYLPVENIELLSRYGHEEGILDRLGGGAWQAKKAKLKQRIKEVAERLIRIAAERALRKGDVMEPIDGGWDAFCAGFPYTETDDQLNAIDDVLEDLASGQPMDRLVCGDVGFGKTEVALRAAFVAASSGHQVAVIAPTTLLARQHFKSFSERFRNTALKVRHLSRFVSQKEANQTRKELAEGQVDIVIGTHALLSEQVKFANIGLLVVDEEQRFGVGHKERLKALKTDIHVLTLSATPIPRTLQMSLSGVRDLSLIATPPVDRLAIRTYVSNFDSITLREALLREHYRGGQSFFVAPRVKDLPDLEEFLKTQVPEVSYVVAHGQMTPAELDDRMNAFYDGKYDVLLATTIVESGLDIPTANTMIIHRADMFGLAQLYQIRGRVGRSKTRAYAYLTTEPRKPLTATAEKRLRVLGSLDSLGAGFTLASQDLDIRGAGNLLGEEQSGNVREVGFELYQEMLEEAIAKIKSGAMEGMPDLDTGWSPVINLGVAVMIPEKFVPDLDVRMGLYRRLSSLTSKVEIEGFAAELIDRFGKLPSEVNNLLRVVRIKSVCKTAGIAKMDTGPKGAVVQFHNEKFANPAGLVEYLTRSNGTAKLKENKLVVRRDWSDEDKKMKGAYIIARDLAGLV